MDVNATLHCDGKKHDHLHFTLDAKIRCLKIDHPHMEITVLNTMQPHAVGFSCFIKTIDGDTEPLPLSIVRLDRLDTNGEAVVEYDRLMLDVAQPHSDNISLNKLIRVREEKAKVLRDARVTKKFGLAPYFSTEGRFGEFVEHIVAIIPAAPNPSDMDIQVYCATENAAGGFLDLPIYTIVCSVRVAGQKTVEYPWFIQSTMAPPKYRNVYYNETILARNKLRMASILRAVK